MERLRAELESRLALLGGHRDFASLAALLHWADSRDAFADWALWGVVHDREAIDRIRCKSNRLRASLVQQRETSTAGCSSW